MFAGNPLQRYNSHVVGSESLENFDLFLQSRLSNESTKFLFTNGSKQKKILCLRSKSLRDSRLLYLSLHQLLLFKAITSIQDFIQDNILILLGCENPQSPDDLQIWQVVIHLTELESEVLNSFNENLSDALKLSETEIFFCGGRDLIKQLSNSSRGSIAIAGQALTMVSWHERSLYDPSTGEKTVAIECGWKRRSVNFPEAPKLYPRIDPVVIACVISPDGSQCLLGNMKSMPKNFFSCLAGFIEPGESVQEAVRREVWEESGIVVQEVEILDSQPWPIGRGGNCELMIGCRAIASTVVTKIQDKDVQEVRWFSLEEARNMLAASKDSIEFPRSSSEPYLPGSYAIAHRLVDNFVQNHTKAAVKDKAASSFLSSPFRTISDLEDEPLRDSSKRGILSIALPVVFSTVCAAAVVFIYSNRRHNL